MGQEQSSLFSRNVSGWVNLPRERDGYDYGQYFIRLKGSPRHGPFCLLIFATRKEMIIFLTLTCMLNLIQNCATLVVLEGV